MHTHGLTHCSKCGSSLTIEGKCNSCDMKKQFKREHIMEEIEVGEYVRTKYGEIAKITQTYPQIKGIKKVNPSLIDYNLIIKHSKNIIDLIEEGDYVNGYYVRKILNYNNELCVFDLNEMDWIPLTEIDVFYSIVTKEQFKSVEYEVK